MCDHIIGWIEEDDAALIIHQSDLARPDYPFLFCPICGQSINIKSKSQLKQIKAQTSETLK